VPFRVPKKRLSRLLMLTNVPIDKLRSIVPVEVVPMVPFEAAVKIVGVKVSVINAAYIFAVLCIVLVPFNALYLKILA